MAADILVYRATHVPVGEDQKQHLELARDIAQKFNNDFGDSIRSHGFNDGLFFPQPEPLITGPATRVMSLRDGTKKMSKSDPSDYSRINLTDDADTIAQKVRKAKTDPEPLPSEEKGLETRPEADNLVGIYAALTGKTKADVLTEFGGAQFSSFKNALVEVCVAKLAPIAGEMKRLMADPGHVDSILTDGADRARVIAAETMQQDEGHRRLHPQALELPFAAPHWRGDVAELHRACRRIRCRGSMMIAPRGAANRDTHEHQTSELRIRPQTEMPGRHRRYAGMRPRHLLRGALGQAHRRRRGDAAGDRDRPAQSGMAGRRRHHARGSP